MAKRTIVVTLSAVLFGGALSWGAQAPAADVLPVKVATADGPARPSAVPVLPGLNVGKQLFFGPLVGRAEGKGDYQPIDGHSFARHNGPGTYNYWITSGAWLLRVGDRPRVLMDPRSGSGAYAPPALLPDIGVRARVRLAVTVAEKTRWLDLFDSIDAVLSPGSARWTCRDRSLGVTVVVRAYPLIQSFGFIATAEVTAAEAKDVTLTWTCGRVKGGGDRVVLNEDFAELSNPGYKYTRVYVGCEKPQGRVAVGEEALLHKSDAVPAPATEADPPCALVVAGLHVTPDAPAHSRLVCVGGYTDYNRQAVAEAYDRLRFRPFSDPQWVEQMKQKWFEHWIGRGLKPGERFAQVRAKVDEAIGRSVEFWDGQRGRMQIATPDPRFDNVVNAVSAQARYLFEYPGFIHGMTYAKYGKINHGYYGFEAAGLHDEVADSLHFVAGTQDAKGRQRYFMTTFAVSDWHEDMDFYFPEQVWYHWRWTGDRQCLASIWPAARRALEHGLAASDPDGDGIMTGYYEMWDSDANNPGGHSALQTALGWSALRAGAEMAAALGDVDHASRATDQSFDPVYTRRYRQRMKQTEQEYVQHLWQNDTAAWSSAETNGLNRPRPHTCEQNYAVWRGIGEPTRNYMAMRYVRENFHRSDLVDGVTYEFINDWWPMVWSHHYVASGDTCASFHSACAAGDTDGFWPAFKSVAETAYSNSGALWHGVGRHCMEMEPLFLQAVVDGLFGVQPWFGENLLVLRPSFPSWWDRAELRHVDVNYTYKRRGDGLELDVVLPAARRLRAELPVRRAVRGVTLNGQPVEYRLKPAVNCCRVVVETPADRRHRIGISLSKDVPEVTGLARVIVGERAVFRVQGAAVRKIHDPQQKIRDQRTVVHENGSTEAAFVPTAPGRFTAFLELQSGETAWLRPLDLEARLAWNIVHRYTPPLSQGGPALNSPAVSAREKLLVIEIDNPTDAPLRGPGRVTVAGTTLPCPLSVAPGASAEIRVSLEEVWDRLSAGSVPFALELAGRTETAAAVNWTLGRDNGALFARFHPLNLAPHYNAEMRKLFSPRTQWRTDYTGAQHGVDWRHPMPLKDRDGYVLMNSVMSIFDYGILPEQWISRTRWETADLPPDFDAGIPVPLRIAPNRILAVCCTQPYDQFPGRVTLTLDRPRRLEKVYLLSANLVKTLKCYYPCAEIAVRYADGTQQLHQMIPPYTMPSMLQHICPRAHAIRFGRLHGAPPVSHRDCHLSVTDVSLDPAKTAVSLEFRSVATETLLGILGVTVLEAEKP